MEIDPLVRAIVEAGCYKLGPFRSYAGLRILTYPELRNLYARLEYLELVGKEFAKKLEGKKIDLGAGVETAGIPAACATSMVGAIPFIYVRRQPKPYRPSGTVFGDCHPGQPVAH